MKRLISLSTMLLILFLGCSGSKTVLEEDLAKQFDEGLELFNAGKYNRAQGEFEYIVMNNPGSQLAIDSEYYLAEALYHQKYYPEAAVEFERYIRYSHDPEKIEFARFRVCECGVNATFDYQKDQAGTMTALNRLQEFIEDFPSSEFVDDAELNIRTIRNRLAQKEYETGRLYLKLEEYESAMIYFESLLEHYYDTDFADDARISIAFTHILSKEPEEAINYLTSNEQYFHDPGKYEEGLQLTKDTANGKLSLEEYIRLYK